MNQARMLGLLPILKILISFYIICNMISSAYFERFVRLVYYHFSITLKKTYDYANTLKTKT